MNRKDFPDDPSNTNPGVGISSRSDLSLFKHYSGGVDAKVSDYDHAIKLKAVAISGPTNENNPNLPTFTWKNVSSVKHEGLPEKYDFPWVLMSPETLRGESKDIFTWRKNKLIKKSL